MKTSHLWTVETSALSPLPVAESEVTHGSVSQKAIRDCRYADDIDMQIL